MRINVATKKPPIYTAEGARASHINAEQQLRRCIMACMLWEKGFYIDGKDIAKVIADQVDYLPTDKLAAIAVEARTAMKLRHAPLWLAACMDENPKHRKALRTLLPQICLRADEPAEFLALLWRDKGTGRVARKISNAAKDGLAEAMRKFSPYALAKYNRDGAVKLRDVLNLTHPKPKDDEQSAAWKKLLDGTLESPDTWEVSLSAGADKKATFTRLIEEKKLGALAMLRNLRNMQEASVDEATIKRGLSEMDAEMVLPFRFIAAARYAPRLEPEIEAAMFRCTQQITKLPGTTVLVIDVSGSMFSSGNISEKSEISRADAACALAALAREACESVRIYATAGDDFRRIHATKEVPARRGFALVDAIRRDMHSELGGGGIFLVQCMGKIWKDLREQTVDRCIVFTDEQDCDNNLNPSVAQLVGRRNYLVNIASEKNGIAYDRWTHLNGFSESVLEYVRQSELAR